MPTAAPRRHWWRSARDDRAAGVPAERLLQPADVAAAVAYAVAAPARMCVTEIDLQPLRPA